MTEPQSVGPAGLLPAWFDERMMMPGSSFGLTLSSGIVLYAEEVFAVHRAADGSLWLDMRVRESDDVNALCEAIGLSAAYVPTGRGQVSVNAAHVVTVTDLTES